MLCGSFFSYWSVVLVVNATSFSRSGVADFLLQRVSAVVLTVYAGCIVWFVLTHPSLDYTQWFAFMRSPAMQIVGTLTLLSWGIHAWIGMWTVGTDYLNEHHIGKFATVLRLLYQFGVTSSVVLYFVLGLMIIW
ncbi:MAG: succinate dehydrogenase, hydrophobic membrane anchor protein [Gammaproteobacteria bacterium]|nr:succinate dehydrogenase, hydrophobic membrane anchor protein [Gammaproteobacteria bacterium]MYF01876.1 succinate dehydrogenase, hydrophobic membrane anchor protein [Gammaproteobacteria bacterium]